MITPELILSAGGDRWQLKLERLEYRRGAITYRLFARQTQPGGGVEDRYYEADTLELGRAIYQRAEPLLAAGGTPDLQAIARELKRRDRKLITTTRQMHRNAGGVLLLGDTPPDEIPGQ